MAGTTLYLIRSNNLTFAKQEGVIDVFLSGSQTAYASVTGNATTEIVTITGATLANGMQVTFTLTANTAYYVIAASGATCQLSLTEGGSAIDFTTNIVSGSVIVSNEQMRVWSAEYRDIFAGLGVQGGSVVSTGGGLSGPVQFGAPQGYGIYADPNASLTPTNYSGSSSGIVVGTPKGTVSDEVGHVSLRQTFLNKSFWIFDRGASATPRYLPAEYQEGDIIATSPPNIP
jgi:hypothetical protein